MRIFLFCLNLLPFHIIMDSKSAKQLLIETENFLSKFPDLDEVISYGKKYKEIQILPYYISDIDIYMSENMTVDEGACFLLPDEFKHYVCANTTANGNCLYNAASYFLIQEELLAVQLRLATIIELMAYANEYLQLEVFEKDYSYSDEAFSNSRNYQSKRYKNKAPFIAEIMKMSCIGAWCSLGAFYGLASVLERPIQSIYPPVKSSILRDFTRIIKPRQEKYNIPITILWSIAGISEKESKELLPNSIYFKSNHFVGCYLLKVFIFI